MTRRKWLRLGCSAAASRWSPGLAAAAPGRRGVRIAISSEVTGPVNGNDARASMAAWAAAVAKSTEFDIDPAGVQVVSPEEMLETVRKGRADALGLTVRHYMQAGSYLAPGEIILDEQALKASSTYQLLVHDKSPARSLGDLKGKSLLVWDNPRLLLAGEWLAVRLAEEGLGSAERFLGHLAKDPKVSSGVVLPVFFRKADACLVGAHAFEGMCELNPQLRKTLRVIDGSPPLVSTFLGFHRSFAEPTRSAFREAVLGLHRSVSGQQALMLFQGVRVVAVSPSILDQAMSLLKAYDRIMSAAPGGRP